MTRERYKARHYFFRLFDQIGSAVTVLLCMLPVGLVIAATAQYLTSTEVFLAWLVFILSALQLLVMVLFRPRTPSEYDFVAVDPATMVDYFRDGEPSERLKDGWRVHLITTEGVLFQR